MRLEVRVQPRASRNEIARDASGQIKLRLTAPPVDGEANRVAVKFLADRFGLSRSSVRLIRGESSKTKIFELDGVTIEDIERALA